MASSLLPVRKPTAYLSSEFEIGHPVSTQLSAPGMSTQLNQLSSKRLEVHKLRMAVVEFKETRAGSGAINRVSRTKQNQIQARSVQLAIEKGKVSIFLFRVNASSAKVSPTAAECLKPRPRTRRSEEHIFVHPIDDKIAAFALDVWR